MPDSVDKKTPADKRLEELESTAVDAIDSIQRLEKLLKDIGRDNLRNLAELLSQTEHDMRMARIRLAALLPRKRTDPDQTPVDPIMRRSSQFRIKKPDE